MTNPVWGDIVDVPEDHARRQQALYDLHQEWCARQVAAGVDGPVPPDRKDGSDYNQHVPDLESDGAAMDEFHTRAREIMGIA